MSTDYRAHAIIGVFVDREEMFTEKKVRDNCGCHEQVPGGYPYCPLCGAKLWHTERYPIFDDEEKIGDLLKVIPGTSFESLAYIGLDTWDDPLYGRSAKCLAATPENIQSVYDELEKELGALGLWRTDVKETFGIHAVLEVY